MARKLTRQESIDRLNQLVNRPSTAEVLADMRAELEEIGTPYSEEAIRLIDMINPRVNERQFWLIMELAERLVDLGIRQKNSESGRKGKLSDEDKIKAKNQFDEFTRAGATPNSAVGQILKSINKGRSKPVGKNAIERAVGIRS